MFLSDCKDRRCRSNNGFSTVWKTSFNVWIGSRKEKFTGRKLFSQSLFLILSPLSCFHLSVYPSILSSVCLPCVFLFVQASVSPFICHPTIHLLFTCPIVHSYVFLVHCQPANTDHAFTKRDQFLVVFQVSFLIFYAIMQVLNV